MSAVGEPAASASEKLAEAGSLESYINEVSSGVKLQEGLRDNVVKIGQARTRRSFVGVDDLGPAVPHEEVSYTALGSYGIDTVIEVAVEAIGWSRGESRTPAARPALFMTARVRLVRVADDQVVDKTMFRFEGVSRSANEWTQPTLERGIDYAFKWLAERIVAHAVAQTAFASIGSTPTDVSQPPPRIKMKTSFRRFTIVSLASILGACASVDRPMSPADREQIRHVAVVENEKAIRTEFELPTGSVSGAAAGGAGGSLAGASPWLIGCFDPVSCGVLGGLVVIGGVLGAWKGAVCGAAISAAEIEEPAAHVKKLFDGIETGSLRQAIEARLEYLKPDSAGSSAVAVPDTLLEVADVVIAIGEARRQSEEKETCPPGLSATARWRALRSADNTVLAEMTTKWSRRASAERFKDWLRNEEVIRADLGLLLDELGSAIADGLLTGKTKTPN